MHSGPLYKIRRFSRDVEISIPTSTEIQMNGNDGDFEDDMVGGDGWNFLDEIDEDLKVQN